MLFPTGKCIFFWRVDGWKISLVQDNGPSLAQNFECFSSKGQKWFLFQIVSLTFHLEKSGRVCVNKNKRLSFFLSPLGICSADSCPGVWLSFLWGSHCASELFYWDPQTVLRPHSDESKGKPGMSTWGTTAPIFWLQPSLKPTWDLPVTLHSCWFLLPIRPCAPSASCSSFYFGHFNSKWQGKSYSVCKTRSGCGHRCWDTPEVCNCFTWRTARLGLLIFELYLLVFKMRFNSNREVHFCCGVAELLSITHQQIQMNFSEHRRSLV